MLSQVRSWMSEGHRLLAETVAQYIDATLTDTLRDLERIPTEMGELDESVRPRLRSARLRSAFNHAIYIVDDTGEVLISDPALTRLPDLEWRRSLLGRSGVHYRDDEPSALVALHEFQRNGRNYQVIAEGHATGSGLSTILRDLASDPSLHMVIVDADARVIAAPDQRQLSRMMHTIPGLTERIRARRSLVTEVTHCPLCAYGGAFEGRNLTVMIPLHVAPWAVVVQQHEPTILSLAETFLVGFVSVTMILGVMGFLLSRSFSQSVILPIHDLSAQAKRMREGDLDSPITTAGDLEMRVLADSLDDARQKIRDSIDELRRLNEDLEKVVDQRTDELRHRIEDLRILLELSTLAGREHDPDVFLPESLDLLSRKFELTAVALAVAGEERADRKIYTPAGQDPPLWLIEDDPAQAPWKVRSLVHLGTKQADLAYQGDPAPDHPLLDAMCGEIAGAVHGAMLLERILAHDARRRELVRRLLRAAEEERLRIARELHDEISQLLTVMQISLEQAASGDLAKVEHTANLLGRTQKEIHRIIHDLRPSLLDDLGLAAAVKWYAEGDLASRGVEVHLEVEEDLVLPGEVEITAFRIFQECVTNILRHARAQNVSIELFRSSDRLILVVEDDGIGFDPKARKDGSGLMGMRERAALIGGCIEIDSEPGQGTTIHLTIPVGATT